MSEAAAAGVRELFVRHARKDGRNSIGGSREPPGTREEGGGTDEVRVKVPVQDAQRAPWLVQQDLGVEREPDEHDGEEPGPDVQQSAMRNPDIEPG